jgi:threonine/homoserine/homoserine lactone efflux protein
VTGGLGSLAAGFLAGLAIAASPGPIFFLVIRRTLERGRRSGLASGAGVATADGIYALVAALGIGVASAALAGYAHWLGAAGGLALVILGVRAMLSRPRHPAAARPAGDAADYASTLALTLGNPQTILAFLAVFAGAGAVPGLGRSGVGWVVPGVLAGSATWWLVLTLAVAALRARLNPASVRAITLVSGAAIAGFGLLALAGVLQAPLRP